MLLISACSQPKTQYLSTAVLEEQVFTVDPTRDTTLLTKAGIIIDIPANAITVPNGGKVDLQIKEALGLKEMLLSGLTTKSDSGLLASQGMFYIGTNTSAAEIKKQISAKLPVDEIIPGMENYAGVYDADSALQWVVKRNVTKPEFDAQDIAEGKSIFERNCRACHSVDQDGTGPALRGSTSRHSMNWLIKFTRNYNDLVDECDCDAIASVNSRATMMNLFPVLTDRDIKKIYAYIEDGKLNTPTSNCADSCKSFMAEYLIVQKQLQALEEQVPASQVEYHRSSTTLTSTPTLPPTNIVMTRSVTPNYLVVPNYPQSYYYKIDIDAWGWYNADILLKDYMGLSPSSLTVSVTDISKDNLNTTLVVPSVKCITHGGLKNGTETDYVFMNNDGTINLPLGQKAYVLAYGDVKGRFFFAAQEFTASTKHTFTLSPKPADPKELEKYLALVSDNAIKAKTEELELGRKKDALDAKMEAVMKLQPANCNCWCYTSEVQNDTAGTNCNDMPRQ